MASKLSFLRAAALALLATCLFAASCGGSDNEAGDGEVQLTVEAAAEGRGARTLELHLDAAQLVTFMCGGVAARLTDAGFFDALRALRGAPTRKRIRRLITLHPTTEASLLVYT